MVTTKALNLFDNFNVNQLTPYAVGFDRVFDRLVDYTNNNMNSTGFPPYNIERLATMVMRSKWLWLVSVRTILKLKLRMVY